MKHAKRSDDTLASQSRKTVANKEREIPRVKPALGMTGTGLLRVQRINHRDVGVDFYGLAVEDGWAVAPFAHGLQG
jgi:hypothetical protein